MRVVENVADEFVVHAEAVLKGSGFQHAVSELFPKLRLQTAQGTLNRRLLHFVAHQEYVYARICFVKKNARHDDELELAAVLKARGNVFLANGDLRHESSQCRQVREPRIDAVTAYFAFLEFAVLP